MYSKVMRTIPDTFHRIPDHFKTQEMCDKAVKKDDYSLQFVPDWFVKQQHIEQWGITIMMVVIGRMIKMRIIFLSGAMGIENERHKKQE